MYSSFSQREFTHSLIIYHFHLRENKERERVNQTKAILNRKFTPSMTRRKVWEEEGREYQKAANIQQVSKSNGEGKREYSIQSMTWQFPLSSSSKLDGRMVWSFLLPNGIYIEEEEEEV
jgi:hypothetical protein